mmetsp:Transcript_38862/g.107044  ORF Transcript_38862/g.107044 Transcript_38862/m.107044 type:complete len:362 (-) Transcript_38862:319-1404(-)
MAADVHVDALRPKTCDDAVDGGAHLEHLHRSVRVLVVLHDVVLHGDGDPLSFEVDFLDPQPLELVTFSEPVHHLFGHLQLCILAAADVYEDALWYSPGHDAVDVSTDLHVLERHDVLLPHVLGGLLLLLLLSPGWSWSPCCVRTSRSSFGSGAFRVRFRAAFRAWRAFRRRYDLGLCLRPGLALGLRPLLRGKILHGLLWVVQRGIQTLPLEVDGLKAAAMHDVADAEASADLRRHGEPRIAHSADVDENAGNADVRHGAVDDGSLLHLLQGRRVWVVPISWPPRPGCWLAPSPPLGRASRVSAAVCGAAICGTTLSSSAAATACRWPARGSAWCRLIFWWLWKAVFVRLQDYATSFQIAR